MVDLVIVGGDGLAYFKIYTYYLKIKVGFSIMHKHINFLTIFKRKNVINTHIHTLHYR